MARGVNKVILVGTLGNDPEVKYMPTGGAVTNISLATNESWMDKNTNQKQERTEWHRVVAFRRLAEIMGEYLRKGSQVYIEGKLQTRKWQDQSGQDRYTTEIVASDMQMLGGRSGGTGDFSGANTQQQAAPQQSYNKPAASQPAAAQQRPQQRPPQQDAPPHNFDDFDDDIPF